MTTFHELDTDTFTALAVGDGGPAAIAELQRAQLSRHLILIGNLLREWPGTPAERDAIGAVLDRARDADPDRFAEVVGAPLVGSWSGIATRALGQGIADPSDFGQLAGIAAVAAAACGVPADLVVPIRNGVASVPGLGALSTGDAPVRLIADGGQLTADVGGRRVLLSGDGDVPGLQRVRDLTAPGVRIALDDVDPYRHGHHAPPANRLDDADFEQWEKLFGEAWGLLTRRLPERAAELAAGLRTLVPLQTDSRAARSATIKYAFGVFGLTLPPSAAEFAVTMVHEFQHSKLSAILDLTPMTDPHDTSRHFAPWRTDPRPLAGLLQGVYAFVGVADSWRGLRLEPEIAEEATRKFAEARINVAEGLRSVEASGSLLPDGVRLVRGLRERTDELLAEPLPDEVVQAAELALGDTLRQWRERNPATAG
ncbi:HEXXH motif domain-containing protein [Hamadaea sp. NPDC051192]|uniref:HEXXH motif domain-containing protein n=1 Tax=Hamadaea sp. NPDC051192 TaxID=3154940 RepID=UPI00341CD415